MTPSGNSWAKFRGDKSRPVPSAGAIYMQVRAVGWSSSTLAQGKFLVEKLCLLWACCCSASWIWAWMKSEYEAAKQLLWNAGASSSLLSPLHASFLITFSYLLSAGHISPLLTSKLCTSSPPPFGLRLCNLSSVGGKAVELALGLSGCTKPPVSLRFPWSITNRPLNLKTREFVLLQKKILKSCWLITGVRFSFMLVANVCKLIYQGVQRGLKLENGFQHVPFRGCCAPLMLL